MEPGAGPDLLWTRPARYAFALCMVALALVLRMILAPLTGTGAPFVLFFGATLVSSLFAGAGPGLCALAFSLPIAAWLFVVRAGYSVSNASFQSVLYALDGLLIVYLTHVANRIRRALEQTNRQLRGANEEVRRSVARIRQIIELAPDAFFQADVDAHFTDCNDSACRMLGYGCEELIGKSAFDIIPAEDAPRLRAVQSELLTRGGVSTAEWTLRRKDGSLVPVEVSSNILPDGRWQGFVRDISERRRTEAERQVFVSLIEASSDFIGIADPGGKPVYVNPAGRRMVGLPADHPIAQTQIPDYYPPEQRSFAAEVILKSMMERGHWSGETSFRNWQTGEAIPVSDSHFMIRDARSGRVLGMGTVTRDISEARRLTREREQLLGREQIARRLAEAANVQLRESEERLRRSEAKFSGIVSISADAIISIDRDQRITIFNDGAEQIFGYSKAEAVGAPLEMLIPQRHRARHHSHVEAFASGRVTARQMGERLTDISGLRKNGEEFPAEAAISKLEVGDTILLTVALRDITERKRLEREERILAEAGAALASSLDYEQTLSTVARLVVRDFADWCIVDVVEGADQPRRIRVVSADPAKAAFCAWAERIPIDWKRPFLLRPVMETRQPLLIEHVTPEHLESVAQSAEHLQSLRTIAPVSLLALPLLLRGQFLGTLALASSTPGHVYGPADLRLTALLADRAAVAIENARLYRASVEASRLRDRVLGVVAHDLRNPLGTILLQASALERHETEPERRSQAEMIHRAARRMNRLIQDLVDVARVGAGELTLVREPLSPPALVVEAADMQRSLAAACSIELRVDVEPDVPEVWGDHDRILQVFENLIGNAMKFTEAGGVITVGTAPRDDEVVFRVSDTGRGIAAEDQPRVFDRFWQATKTGRGGAGLGLAIIKGIVEAHGGRVWVESAAGQGSTFFFSIPRFASAGDRPPAVIH